jgi:lipopolysaccharide export system protein LptA
MAPSGSRHPEWVRSTGNVRGILAAEGPATTAAAVATGPRKERQYAGDQSLVSFGPDGKPTTLTLNGAPALLWEAGRRLTAKQIDVGFADGRVASARASGGVGVESENGHAEADQASLGIGKDGEAENVTLDGHVRVDDQGRKGQAARAVEVKAGGIWLLTGDASQAARVESGGSRLSADRIELDREHKQIRAEGRARAVFSPDPQRREPTVTFVGDPKRPSYAKADRISVDDASHLVALSGAASLWQDTSSLFADDITLSDAEKSVTAVNAVRAVMSPAKDKDRPASADDKTPSVILAKHLLYRDTDRSARFEGGVTVTRGGWRATGGESTAWISKEKDRGVDCVETSGDVHMVDRTVGRTATAEKAVDYPKQGKTTLWGSPARVTDASGNQVAGAILTMTDRGRSVEITAPEGGKTETIHRTQKN